MKPVVLLRIASVLTFIHAVLHTIGGVFGAPQPGPQQVAVDAMKSNHFQLMGVDRTLWDFHFGFGLGISIFLLAESLVFWQLAALAQTNARPLRPILSTFALAYLTLALNSYKYFFFAPVVTELLIVLCLVMAVVGIGRAETA